MVIKLDHGKILTSRSRAKPWPLFGDANADTRSVWGS